MAGLSLFAGVDGGGSKTLAIVVDEAGNECGRALAGSSNYAAVGLDYALHSIRTAIDHAARQAGVNLPIAAAWIGLAGVDRPADHTALLPHLQMLARRVRLTNDADLALAALPDALGVAAIAGTGTIVLGRDASGADTRASGWGHILGDEGSGYDIARLALQTVCRAADGRGPSTLLTDAILDVWHLNNPSDLIQQVYHEIDKAGTAKLASTVFSVARSGDPEARRLVAYGAKELALAIVTVANRLTFPNGITPLALAGGLFVKEASLRQSVLRRVRLTRTIDPVEIVSEPAASAARAAIGIAG